MILGDQNADPLDGDSVDAAIDQLLDHPRITDPLPTSAGAVEASALQGGANLDARGRPGATTRPTSTTTRRPATCAPTTCCPRATCGSLDAGVFWPVQADPLSALTGDVPVPESDHRLVWVDLRVHG